MKPTLSPNYIPPSSSYQYQNTLPSYPSYNGYQHSAGTHLAQIQGQSHIQYIPYNRKIIEYQDEEVIQYVPYEKKIIQYEERKRIQKVPVQKTYTDYYTVEHITQYIPQVIPETHIEYVPVQKIQHRLQYYPVERQYVINPDQLKRYDNSNHYTLNRGEHNANINKYKQTTFTPSASSYNNSRQLPSYPVYNPNLHKVIQGSRPTQSYYSYLNTNKSTTREQLQRKEETINY